MTPPKPDVRRRREAEPKSFQSWSERAARHAATPVQAFAPAGRGDRDEPPLSL